MRFQVPQFTDIEDKIIGPLTLKQFLYVAGGGGIAVVLYFVLNPFLPLIITLILITPFIALALALAFVQINNRPFIMTLEAMFNFFVRHRLYIWKRDVQTSQSQFTGHESGAPSSHKTSSKSKLADMAWKLDVNENNEEEE